MLLTFILTQVSQTGLNSVLASEAYILFYVLESSPRTSSKPPANGVASNTHTTPRNDRPASKYPATAATRELHGLNITSLSLHSLSSPCLYSPFSLDHRLATPYQHVRVKLQLYNIGTMPMSIQPFSAVSLVLELSIVSTDSVKPTHSIYCSQQVQYRHSSPA